MQRLDPVMVMSRNTWYFLGINSCQQMLYCLKRINEPLREHIGNGFLPLPQEYHERFRTMRDDVVRLYTRALEMLQSGDFTDAERLREDGDTIQSRIIEDRKNALDTLQEGSTNLNTLFMTTHIMQESQQMIDSLRHMVRGMDSFAGSGERARSKNNPYLCTNVGSISDREQFPALVQATMLIRTPLPGQHR